MSVYVGGQVCVWVNKYVCMGGGRGKGREGGRRLVEEVRIHSLFGRALSWSLSAKVKETAGRETG